MGGLERVVVDLSRELCARGHAVTVVAAAGGELWGELPDGVRRLASPARETRLQKLHYFLWLARALRSGRFDVVHAHQRTVALQARVARAATRLRVVEHVHNVFTPDHKTWVSFRGDHLVACGPAVADMLVRDFRRPPDRISTVVNSVPDLSGGTPPPLPVSQGGRPPSVLVVARVTQAKDPHRFIDVVSELNAGQQRVEAVWVGTGDLWRECVDEVERRRVPGLSFVGEHRDVVPFLRRADLVMLTSRQEGLPLSLLEAASMGRPLVAPRIGSCPTVVQHGQNGLLFDVDSSPAAIAALVAPVLARETLERMGRASRRAYLSRFTPRGQVERLEEVYRTVVGR
ncbi:glycosyltransferase family 4 protein [Geodermatophilus sp. URMC 63]